MKHIQVILLGLIFSANCFAQTEFDNVFKGCCLAVYSLDNGTGSQSGVREAAQMLKDANWSSLYINAPKGQKEIPIGNHLLFTDSYLTDLANGHIVKKKAREYAAEERGGDGVRLCTKVIKGKQIASYSFNYAGGKKLSVGIVAESNGMMNLKVKAKKKNSNEPVIEKTEHSNEYKGASNRRIDFGMLPSGLYIITIEITNKYNKDRSCAIIVN